MCIRDRVYAVGFHFYLKGGNMIEICNIMVLCFTFGTIFLLNGFHKRTWAAVCSTLCVFAVIMGIFHFVIYLYGDVDYSSMEYLGSVENPAQMFEAEVMLAGLGAIMEDVYKRQPFRSSEKVSASGVKSDWELWDLQMH